MKIGARNFTCLCFWQVYLPVFLAGLYASVYGGFTWLWLGHLSIITTQSLKYIIAGVIIRAHYIYFLKKSQKKMLLWCNHVFTYFSLFKGKALTVRFRNAGATGLEMMVGGAASMIFAPRGSGPSIPLSHLFLLLD